MDIKLKQRVTGAIVLTALAIIIVPMLLDGSKDDRARVIASIPEPPMVELDSLTLEDIEREMDALEQEGAAAMPENAPPESAATEAPPESMTLDEDDLPVSWSLQLGSFENEDNARGLRASLRDAEFQSYILEADTEQGQMYRVFVGPVLQRSQLTTIGEEIEARFELKGQIVRYNSQDDVRQLGG